MPEEQEDTALGQGPPEEGDLADDAVDEFPAEDDAVIDAPPPAAPPRQNTLAIAAIMLGVGMVLGFLMRPMVPLPAAPAPTAVPTAAQLTGTPAAAAKTTAAPSPTANPTAVAQQKAEFAAYVAANTRHFRGSANAPVTLIEFSDYQ